MGEMLGKMISECELYIQKSLKEYGDGVKKYTAALDECIALKIPFPVYNINGKIWPKDFFPDKPIVNTYGELFLWMFDKNGIRRYPKNVIDPDAGTYIDPVTGKDVLNEMYRVKVPYTVKVDNDTDDEGKPINKVSVDESIDRIYTLLNRYEDDVSRYKQWSKVLEIGSEKFSNLVLDTILGRVSGDYIKSKWTKSTIYDHWHDGFQGKLPGSEIGVIDIIGRQYPIEQNIYGGNWWLFIEMPWKIADGAVYNALIERINNGTQSQSDAVQSAATQSVPDPTPKIRLNIVGIEEGLKVVAKQDLPDFKIYVGDIPIEDNLIRSNDYDDFDDSEYVEADYGAYEEEKIVFDGEVIIAFSDSELSRDNKVSEASVSEGAGAGVNKGSDKIVAPGAVVPTDKVVLGAFAGVRGSNIMTKQSTGSSKIDIADFITPNGEKISKSEIIKNINEFVADVLAPFSIFLKAGYPDLYKNWIVTSATRAYVPKGGSSTSQHFRGQAIDSQIIDASAQNPDGNIRLLNAMLAWYEKNPVGYGQILFETRGKSCWVHWSYKRGNTRLMLARFKEDSTLNTPANTVGKYVLPPLTSKSLGFA
jgi:hypothetical protein